MKLLARIGGALLGALTAAPAAAQPTDIALDTYQPTEAGDDFMATPSAAIDGHLEVRGQMTFDYADDPLVIVDAQGEPIATPVTNQTFLHLGVSLALWDQILVGASLPVALAQGGQAASADFVPFEGASGADAGDLRLGLRSRLLGEAGDPLELSLGASFFVPTGTGPYTGDRSFYAEPQVLASGKVSFFQYAANIGFDLRSSANPSSFVYRAAAGALLLDELLLVGPELIGGVDFGGGDFSRESDVHGEILGTAQVRLPFGLTVGLGAGPGFTQGIGTPDYRVLARVAWDPAPEKPEPDGDGDGVADAVDRCPEEVGVKAQRGCPADADEDGIPDTEDACPKDPGVDTADPTTNGCPAAPVAAPAPDADHDGVADADDACPGSVGPPNDDAAKNGCPRDGDGDGIGDTLDACPEVPGVASDDATKRGCPADRDGDGIADADDDCPDEAGHAGDDDTDKKGCPEVRITGDSIAILHTVEFENASATILPASDSLLDEVAKTFNDHPEIELVEVRGHTDTRGDAAGNRRLSQRRAEAVVAALVKRGVDASRLKAKGLGSSKPLSEEDTDAAHAKNRRVEFHIERRKTP